MSSAGYVSLTRQTGLLSEMQTIANNIANLATTGYRREGVVFAEFIRDAGRGQDSVSYADAHGRLTDAAQGALDATGSAFDFAIEGPGFFLLDTPDGERLTRAGAFTPNQNGELVSPDGFRLLDSGGAAIFIPPDAGNVALAGDGTLSADGQPLARVGIYLPEDPNTLSRSAGTMFRAEGGIAPVENPRLFQGFLEQSNVSPVSEMARMIEVQRAYELGQKFLDREDDRVRAVIRTLGQS
ncbi:MAG: flagellar hook-basal body complex protein [Rhodobacteraceae bacterium]|nr:flagellar hook-basal body complex protein [Paracoccaceae bacterium]